MKGKRIHIVDLSRPLRKGMPVFPGHPPTYIGAFRSHEETRTPAWSSMSCLLLLSDHAGTHVDATLHFNPKGESAEKIPLEVMMGPAALADFSDKSAGESITPQEARRRLAENGIEPEGLKILLFRTGAAEHYGTPRYFEYFLHIEPDTVRWMLDAGISVFGVDAITIDRLSDKPTHMLVRERAFYHMENLDNLDKLPTGPSSSSPFPSPLRARRRSGRSPFSRGPKRSLPGALPEKPTPGKTSVSRKGGQRRAWPPGGRFCGRELDSGGQGG